MPSVGPELPPHLVKRKRSVDKDEDPRSPPRKVVAATAPRAVGPSLPSAAPTVGTTIPQGRNPDELDVEDTSEDDYGPSLGPSRPSTRAPLQPTKQVLGPAPSPTTTANPDELNVDDDSSDNGYGPSAPTSKPKPTAPLPPKRVLGPALPPAPLSELPSYPSHPTDDNDSSSDDDFGPPPPPAPGSAAETAHLLRLQQESLSLASQPTSAPKPQRDDWMLVPPSDSDWSSRVDPTKLKNRKFASGKGAKAPAEKSGISAIWTETPEQKRQRLADEVLGRTDTSSSSSRNQGPQISAEQLATEKRIREHNEKNRGKSLLEVRRAEQDRGRMEREEEDDPSKRGFDRERDMALGGRMGEGKKKEMLERAADFGTRFQRGRYL